MKSFFLLIALILFTSFSFAEMFQPHDNKHHVYRSCGEALIRRVSFLCNGGSIRSEVLNVLDCCAIGCTDKQLFFWCDV
ncbi:unnamed protein product [Caenorhabditis sp. 36 PRJEB53466]|nr:unnamed protein product [Caenorhabditis sp. 36 PRJEB53466]